MLPSQIPISVTATDSIIANANANANAVNTRQSLTPQVSPHLNPARPTSEIDSTTWTSPSSTASIPAYINNYEAKYAPGPGPGLTNHASLTMNNLYARSLHTPFYQMDMTLDAHHGFGMSAQQGPMSLLGTPVALGQGDLRLPVFDVKAYTFRKKPRHYVAVKHKNALRIEPIIYLKTSILDENRQVVRDWDYLRFNMDRFREQAQPKKKLMPEEMRGARILDVDIVLVSPNNNDRPIEDSCPACVMRMDGERRIMQVLAKNFKQTPTGQPVIDIRKGHAIVCIKLNCYCDHHGEQEGFVVRLQTNPEVVRKGGSVKLRICCEARSKSGPAEQDVEEEDGLTDIDAPASTGSRSPAVTNDQMLQSPSLSYESLSPFVKSHQRTPSTNSSSIASPRSMDERVVSSLAVENTNGRVIAPPKFRQIYPLTPSEGTILGGTRVTIHGAHFDVLQNPVVYFGKIPAELVTISHHDVMECTTPPAENLKPGIVAVQIASLAFPLGTESDSVNFMYMAPPDYDFCNLAATSLSYSMASEYPQDNSLAFILNAHLPNGGGLGLLDDATTFVGNDFDVGFSYAGKEDMALDFLRTIQILAPGRILPSFRSDSGHTLLHLAAQGGMARLVRELLDMGIDHTALDRNNKTALHFAEMVGNQELVQLLSAARVPPRPMVPRLGLNPEGLAMKDLVAGLVQKHGEQLAKVLAQEKSRKTKQLQELQARAAHVMEARDQATREAAAQRASASHPRVTLDDTEEDDIMIEDMSNPSSPEGKHSDDGMSGDDLSEQERPDNERKRKAQETGPNDEGTPRKLMKEPSLPTTSTTPSALNEAQLGYIRSGTTFWEKSNGTLLFGDTAKLSRKTPLQTWICDSWSMNLLKDTTTLLSTTTPPTALHVMALTGTGLHHFTEFQSAHGSAIRSLEHWSLLEMEQLAASEALVNVEMCGLVSRAGRDLQDEQVAFSPKGVSSAAVKDMITNAHGELMDHLGLKRKFVASTSTPPRQLTKSQDDQITSGLKLYSKLFNIPSQTMDDVIKNDYLFKREVFTLKPVLDGRLPHNVFIMAAVLKTLRDLDGCSKVRFEGVQVLDDGWSRPELVKEVERLVRDMKQVDRWNFADCGWTAANIEGFVQGFKAPSLSGQGPQRRPCERVSMAGNDFGGQNEAGFLLAEAMDSVWPQLRALDVAGCNIGLQGMDRLVHRLANMGTIKLQGNQADARWWQWMDSLLEKNTMIEKCGLGARIKPATGNSVVSLHRLLSLRDLTVLDLSASVITSATTNVLEQLVPQRPTLQTLSLAHCELTWTDLSSLFGVICKTNESKKFTLDVGQNPLFDSEDSIQSWCKSIEDAETLPMVPFGIKAQGLLIRDSTLQRFLQPLESTTCFNELNIKQVCVKRESQVKELEGLGYDDAAAKIRPEDASEESCLALERVLSNNQTLIMLDVSGREVQGTGLADAIMDDSSSSTSTSTTTAGPSVARRVWTGQSTGGFGRQIWMAFPGLTKNNTLRMLSMDHNNFGEQGMEKFAEAMKANKSIGVVSCDGNDAFTYKALQAIERILPPVGNPIVTGVRTGDYQQPKSYPNMFKGTMEEAQALGYNSTLSIWTFKHEEIQMHMELLSKEVMRQLAERDRCELHAREAVKGSGAMLAEAIRKHEAAIQNRNMYFDTYERIVLAIQENDRRTRV
ncbi:SPT3 Dosage dependent suppressor of Ty-induced promoter mutations-like protein [Podila clonocystis]|nr:SPT3 Dosage dependent suppressor of Ty-induced promoter mutations-like protein [Podila clonocystis]